jgi:hypothetical protein
MMNLDEAIQSFEDEMEKQTALGHSEHIDNLEQMSEWLKELKAYKEKETCETCGHYKAYQHGADITTMDDECGGCCSWNSKWIPKTCGDAISRKHLLEEIALLKKSPWFNENTYGSKVIRKEAVEIVEDVCIKREPSVTPQQRTGRWERSNGYYKWMCSNCRNYQKSRYHYCPSCGAKMVEPQESEVQI